MVVSVRKKYTLYSRDNNINLGTYQHNVETIQYTARHCSSVKRLGEFTKTARDMEIVYFSTVKLTKRPMCCLDLWGSLAGVVGTCVCIAKFDLHCFALLREPTTRWCNFNLLSQNKCDDAHVRMSSLV